MSRSLTDKTIKRTAIITFVTTLLVAVLHFIADEKILSVNGISAYISLFVAEGILFCMVYRSFNVSSSSVNKVVYVSGVITVSTLYLFFTIGMIVVCSYMDIRTTLLLTLESIALSLTVILVLIFTAFSAHIAEADSAVLQNMKANEDLLCAITEIAKDIKAEKYKEKLEQIIEIARYTDKTIISPKDDEIRDQVRLLKDLISTDAEENEVFEVIAEVLSLYEKRRRSSAAVKRGGF